ncbi:hypothetical protein [Pimelobacter simplex]|uniref:hypothetical protein n=1 Tax=Nocardioides simplex TaxID=2045 RepID=UPI00193374C6|nr:hypothetical protein [Pimelobacter simplex]
MWGLVAAIAALVGTALQVGTSLLDLKEGHPDELKIWKEEGDLMDELSWVRQPVRKARYYVELVRIRTSREHRVILKVQAVLWGWIFLAIAALFGVVAQVLDMA